jgi:hypothetical protein
MAVDSCEPEVITALEKQGWRLVKRPVAFRSGKRSVYADLGLSRTTEDGDEFIVIVEVKCFTNPDDDLQEFYKAVGQYALYQELAEEIPYISTVYLAIPDEAYERLLNTYNVIRVFQSNRVNLVIIDISELEVVQWITWTPS